MISICCGFWGANKFSKSPSRHYTEADVEKLYRGFARNLSVPFRFICWSDRERSYKEPIEQRLFHERALTQGLPHYGSLTQCFELNEPSIMVGLDTIVVGNCDNLAAYCIGSNKPAAPMDPYQTWTVCNGVVLVPGGCDWMWRDWPGNNDMDHIRDLYKQKKLVAIDDIFPNQVVSYKGRVMERGLEDDTRLVYFHGILKPHELPHVGWIHRHWGSADEHLTERPDNLAAEFADEARSFARAPQSS